MNDAIEKYYVLLKRDMSLEFVSYANSSLLCSLKISHFSLAEPSTSSAVVGNGELAEEWNEWRARVLDLHFAQIFSIYFNGRQRESRHIIVNLLIELKWSSLILLRVWNQYWKHHGKLLKTLIHPIWRTKTAERVIVMMTNKSMNLNINIIARRTLFSGINRIKMWSI